MAPKESAYPNSMYPLSLGISKRELFTAMAMQGISAGLHSIPGNHNTQGDQFDAENTARMSVAYADALIAELKKTQVK